MHEIGRPDHASTEQLSALLDDRAEPGERWFLAEHVDECEQCASELNGLRSVRMLLRALPVHLPPRDFTIPTPMVRPVARPSRLLPLTRSLGALAAVLCVVFFSADALLLGTSSSKQFQAASDAAMITNATRVNGEDRAIRSAAESAAAARPADAAAGRTEYPPAAAAAPAAPAPAQAKPAAAPPVAQAPKAAEAAKPAAASKPAEQARPADAPVTGASAKPPAAPPPPPGAAAAAAPAEAPARSAASSAPAATLAPLGTVTAFQAAATPPLATMPPQATTAAIAAPPQAPAGTGAAIAPPPAAARADMPVYLYGVEVTPLRVGGVILGVIAAVLFFCAAMMSRSRRATERSLDGRSV